MDYRTLFKRKDRGRNYFAAQFSIPIRFEPGLRSLINDMVRDSAKSNLIWKIPGIGCMASRSVTLSF
jgi:hypothetical protein